MTETALQEAAISWEAASIRWIAHLRAGVRSSPTPLPCNISEACGAMALCSWQDLAPP